MKKFSLIILLAISSAFSNQFLLGLRNSNYGYIAFQSERNFGFALENSIFIQKAELQYIRGSVFYTFLFNKRINGFYTWYYGTRYNNDYFDYGSIFSLNFSIIKKHLSFEAKIQPYFDSDFGRYIGYATQLHLIPFDEIGVNIGFKNIPEFRINEYRFWGGLTINVQHLLLKPYVSIPLDESQKTSTRFNIDFTYYSSF